MGQPRNSRATSPEFGPSVDIERARALWDEYCQRHDTAPRHGQTAGIEPASGRIWFGDSAVDVHRQKVADGIDAPLYVVRVGYDYYLRKGRRR